MSEQKLVKTCTALGELRMVPEWMLFKQQMEKLASKHYGVPIICDPGIIYDSRIAVVWRCRSCCPTLKVEGYFYFHNVFRDYPRDFEYEVFVFIPFSHVMAKVGNAEVNFHDGKLTFLI